MCHRIVKIARKILGHVLLLLLSIVMVEYVQVYHLCIRIVVNMIILNIIQILIAIQRKEYAYY